MKSLEDKLFLNRYQTDKETHLAIRERNICLTDCKEKWCTFICPAKVYAWDEEKKMIVTAYEGCLECGSCRYGCLFGNIVWTNPRGGFGIMYKFG